jgi:hypothetical protein
MAQAATGEEITINSIPNLDDWGPDKYWYARDWMEWHKILKAKKGKKYADETWLNWWRKQTDFAYPLDAIALNVEFRNYLKKEDLYNRIAAAGDTIVGMGTDVVSSVGSVISEAGKGAENFAKTLRIVIPIVVVIFGIGLSVWAYKKFIK